VDAAARVLSGSTIPASYAREVTTHGEEVERWRAGRLAALTGPEGWLAIVGLTWLRDGSNSIGSTRGSDIMLPRGPARLGSIEVSDGAATFVPAADADGVRTADGEPVTEPLPLVDDQPGPPTKLRLDSVVVHVIRRGDTLGVRVRDAEAPARQAFRGIEIFPVDERWRLEATFESGPPDREVRVPTVLGVDEVYGAPGAVAFEVEGRTHRLEPYLEAGSKDWFFVFGDATNGRETFGGGRYLYAPPPGDDGRMLLDFNRAYNPPCVFVAHVTCPLPRPENRLTIEVTAGEKFVSR